MVTRPLALDIEPQPHELDEVVVARAVSGYPPGRELTARERIEAVRILTDRADIGELVIAERLNIPARAVARIRADLAAAAR